MSALVAATSRSGNSSETFVYCLVWHSPLGTEEPGGVQAVMMKHCFALCRAACDFSYM
jgi:hypothetical protein